MADNETVAAILAAGMLYPVLPPAMGPGGAVERGEQVRFVKDVLHAVALYRAVLEAMGNPRRFHSVGVEACKKRTESSISNFAADFDAIAKT